MSSSNDDHQNQAGDDAAAGGRAGSTIQHDEEHDYNKDDDDNSITKKEDPEINPASEDDVDSDEEEASNFVQSLELFANNKKKKTGQDAAGDTAKSDRELYNNGMRFQSIAVSKYLDQNLLLQSILGCISSFSLYFATCSLRKPFTAGTYEDENGESLEWFSTGMSLKTAIVLFQLVGFTMAKWLAIKVVSEAKGSQDVWLAGVNILAELTLILFGVIGQSAPNWSPLPMLFNGLMVGMVWGLVVLYFDGRRGSDVLLVFLSISLIVSHGVVKDVALAATEDWGVPEFWMPAAVGALFLPICLLSLLTLNQLPPPTMEEVLDKGERVSMDHASRLAYFKKFWPGLTCLWIGYVFPTAYRDYRDSFAVDIFADMNYELEPGMLGRAETIVAAVLLIPVAALVFIKSNVFAFKMAMLSLIVSSV